MQYPLMWKFHHSIYQLRPLPHTQQEHIPSVDHGFKSGRIKGRLVRMGAGSLLVSGSNGRVGVCGSVSFVDMRKRL